MAKQLQLRRGTTAQHSTFTGAVGEVTIDTDKDVVVVHDGSTAGGTPLAKDSAKVDKVSSTDNAIVRFDGTSGAVQDSSVVINDDGSVGIGTNSPYYKLDIYGSNALIASTDGMNTSLDTNPIVKHLYNTNGTAGTYVQDQYHVKGAGIAQIAYFRAISNATGYAPDISILQRTGSAAITERMRIDSAGNIGIGTSSPAEKLSILGGNLLIDNDASSKIILGKGADGVDGNCQIGVVQTGSDTDELGLVFKTHDNAAGSSLAVEKMRIDHTGNVGIGTSSPSAPLHIIKTTNSLSAYFNSLGGWTQVASDVQYVSPPTGQGLSFGWNKSGGQGESIIAYDKGAGLSGGLVFVNNSGGSYTTTMTLDASGNLNIGGEQKLLILNGASGNITYLRQRNTSDTNAVLMHQIGVTKAAILANGSYQSATNSYGGTSDAKLKENIVDTTPKLDKLMQVQVRNFNYIGEEQKQIGVVAQEIEKIFPSIVYETKDTKQVEVEKERVIPAIEEVTEQKLITEAVLDEEGNVITEAVYETVVVQEAKPESIEKYTETETVETGEVTKNVKYSVIYMMMLKGMQEQQQIIDDLKARIEALEAK